MLEVIFVVACFDGIQARVDGAIAAGIWVAGTFSTFGSQLFALTLASPA
jgi:hypothetical protein